ncbi:MAG: radical SAM protein [Desulfurivibrionaceae bacterium]
MRHRRPDASHEFPRERGSWKKSWKGRLPVGLLFPNTYGVGMSNLGLQLVYELVNQNPDLVCERIFLPDGEDKPLSVESSRPLADFPVILCSISFEQDIPSLVRMLISAGLEPLAEERQEAGIESGRPLIIGGGVCCFINPETVAPFFDMLVIGEAEPVLPAILERLSAAGKNLDRRELLRRMAVELPGCYVPRFYHFKYGPDQILREIEVEPGIPRRVKRLGIEAPEVAGHSAVLTPAAEFADLYMVELGRGCSKGCRFCAAGFVYRPPRLWSGSAIVSAIEERPEGADKIGLLGMEMVRSGELQKVAERLLLDGCQLSFSSLRADVIGDSLLTLLAGSGLKTVAIAPDGGSERLRRVINKGISREDVLRGAEKLVKAGIVNLKLYFMIGLPTEIDADLDEMAKLVTEVREIMNIPGRARGRLSTLILSINPFVPKAWTPFQYQPFAGVNLLKKKLKYLRQALKGVANLKIMGENPNNAFLQAVLARGDRRLAPALIELATVGGNWRQAMRKNGINPEHYALRSRDRFELLPWEVIDHGIKGDYLWAEYQRALAGRATGPCETSRCRRCGVCVG